MFDIIINTGVYKYGANLRWSRWKLIKRHENGTSIRVSVPIRNCSKVTQSILINELVVETINSPNNQSTQIHLHHPTTQGQERHHVHMFSLPLT